MRIYFTLSICFWMLSTSALSQPALVAWKHASNQRLQAQQNSCEREINALFPGEEARFFPDTSGGFTSISIVNASALNFGSADAQGDSIVIYNANTGIIDGGFDTVSVEACLTNVDSCRQTAFTFSVGRRGIRSTITASLNGGDRQTHPLNQPNGELFCGSIMTTGTYEGTARRQARFLDYVPGDTLFYEAARIAGVDLLQCVLCNEVGTCDTTDLEFTILTDVLDLPFCDDFSGQRGTPNPVFWQEDDVLINSGFGVSPPTVGVATFDALEEGGTVYGEGFGQIDQLTSARIDASGATDLYLKYWLQLGGLGQAPDRMDRFSVEARDVTGNWVQLAEVEGSATGQSESTFRYNEIELLSSEFAHEALQIRFSVSGNLAGSFDIWNLDYVRVEEGSTASNFSDIALTQKPNSLFAPYTSLPFSQFNAQPSLITDQAEVGIFNHFAAINNISNSKVKVRDANGQLLLDANLLTAQQFNLDPGAVVFTNTIPSAPFSSFSQALTTAGQDQLIELTTSYELGIDQDQEQTACVLRNDTASIVNVIDDYYAYDDGSAEGGLQPGGVGERIAVRYEAFTTDTLRGLRFSFPRLGPADANSQLINLQVYIGTLDDEPEYEEIFARPYFVSDVRDTLDAFTTFGLVDALGDPTFLVIPPGNFYVGWQQASEDNIPVPVGMDFSGNNNDAIFAEFGQGWTQLDDPLFQINGNLMIRPVFSDEALANSSSTLEQKHLDFTVQPNPNNGTFRLLGLPTNAHQYTVDIIDANGRIVYTKGLEETVNINLPPGIYVIKTSNSVDGTVGFKKFIIQ